MKKEKNVLEKWRLYVGSKFEVGRNCNCSWKFAVSERQEILIFLIKLIIRNEKTININTLLLLYIFDVQQIIADAAKEPMKLEKGAMARIPVSLIFVSFM